MITIQYNKIIILHPGREEIHNTTSTGSTSKNTSTRTATTTTIVLVDPPRSGLSNDVIQFLLYNPSITNIQHVLYISCGIDALKRDIRLLVDTSTLSSSTSTSTTTSNKTNNTNNNNENNHYPFIVVDCIVLDLFPGTSSVETLIHFQRK